MHTVYLLAKNANNAELAKCMLVSIFYTSDLQCDALRVTAEASSVSKEKLRLKNMNTMLPNLRLMHAFIHASILLKTDADNNLKNYIQALNAETQKIAAVSAIKSRASALKVKVTPAKKNSL